MIVAGHRGIRCWGVLLASACIAAGADAQEPIERGRLQRDRAELDDAQASYLEGISELVAEHGDFSPMLIEPYAELARIYLLSDQPVEAITVLEEARRVTQRNSGLFNLEQVALLDELGRAHLLMGDTLEALNLQRERLTVALRRFGEDDPRTIPFRNDLADYYDRSRMRMLAREEYEVVVDILRENFGADDGRLLDPLSHMTAIDILLGETRAARRQLQQVLESSTNATPVQRAGALAVLGDWELSRRRTEAALEYYREAHAALAAGQTSLAVDFFAAPQLIYFVPPTTPVDWRGNRGSHAWGSMEARFTVSADGTATDIAIVRSEPAGLMDAPYARRLAEARFRPRFVDGEPVATATVSYSHEFRYFVQE